jgi:hypothetical protein
MKQKGEYEIGAQARHKPEKDGCNPAMSGYKTAD